MADQLTDALTRFVDNPSFRRDAARFLSLPKTSVDELTDIVESHGTFDVPSSDVSIFEQVCNLKGQGRQVLEAARLIRSAVRRLDRTDERHRSLMEFAALMNVDPFDPADFSRFFSALPELEKGELKNAAIALAPTVVDTHLYSDLRVISHGSVEDCKLVPVVFARLQFDELVAGQHALFIQLTEESLADLKREIEQAEVTLRGIRDRLGEHVFVGEKNADN